MTIGTVKSFDADKGDGVIQPDGCSPDNVVPIPGVEAGGMTDLVKDQRLNDEIETGRNGKSSAVNLPVAD